MKLQNRLMKIEESINFNSGSEHGNCYVVSEEEEDIKVNDKLMSKKDYIEFRRHHSDCGCLYILLTNYGEHSN
jgi:hypothetical protein